MPNRILRSKKKRILRTFSLYLPLFLLPLILASCSGSRHIHEARSSQEVPESGLYPGQGDSPAETPASESVPNDQIRILKPRVDR